MIVLWKLVVYKERVIKEVDLVVENLGLNVDASYHTCIDFLSQSGLLNVSVKFHIEKKHLKRKEALIVLCGDLVLSSEHHSWDFFVSLTLLYHQTCKIYNMLSTIKVCFSVSRNQVVEYFHESQNLDPEISPCEDLIIYDPSKDLIKVHKSNLHKSIGLVLNKISNGVSKNHRKEGNELTVRIAAIKISNTLLLMMKCML